MTPAGPSLVTTPGLLRLNTLFLLAVRFPTPSRAITGTRQEFPDQVGG